MTHVAHLVPKTCLRLCLLRLYLVRLSRVSFGWFWDVLRQHDFDLGLAFWFWQVGKGNSGAKQPEDLLERKFPMTSIRMVSCKVAADQLIFTPITASSLFFLTTLLEGKSVQSAREKVEERLLPTLKMNWCIWPFIQAVNLSVVPPPWRILVINAACIPWLAFVSWMANKRTEHGTAATGSITWPEPSWTKLSTGRIQEAVV